MADDPDQDITVGELVGELILLERDATAAYVRILQRLEDPGARQEIAGFLENRQRRLVRLTMMSFTLQTGSPGEATASHYLPTGRITLDALSGDAAILNAMRIGEAETVAAYERASTHSQASLKCRAIFVDAHRDAVQHFYWTERAARVLQKSAALGSNGPTRGGERASSRTRQDTN